MNIFNNFYKNNISNKILFSKILNFILEKILKNRKVISIFISIIIIIIIFCINFFIVQKTNDSWQGYLFILVPIMNIVNEFLPDIIYKTSGLISNSSSQVKDTIIKLFKKYLNDYYGISSKSIRLNVKQEFYLILEDLINACSIDNSFKMQILILFFVKNNEFFEDIKTNFNVISYVKNKYRDSLNDEGKEYFVYAYNHLIIYQNIFQNIESYFSIISDEEYEKSLINFLNYYSKDDCLDYLTKKMKFTKGKITKFQNAFKSVVDSKNISLKYLKDLLNTNTKYSKAFLLISEDQLPSKIQTYIKQNPYFILNWSSIANMPMIGTSERFDVFLFSPQMMYPTPEVLYKEFLRIDSGIKNHPLKIYMLDPFESFENKISESNEFLQAINYFEFGTYDFTNFEKLTKQQILSILEQNKISLKEIIQELPLSAFSEKILNNEKEIFDVIGKRVLKDENGKYNIFELIKSTKFKKEFISIKPDDIKYSRSDTKSLFNGKVTKPKLSNRIEIIYKEIYLNLKKAYVIYSNEIIS